MTRPTRWTSTVPRSRSRPTPPRTRMHAQAGGYEKGARRRTAGAPPAVEVEWQRYEITGPKIISKLSLARETAAGWSYARFLWATKEGKNRTLVVLRGPEPELKERPVPPCHPGCFPAGTPIQVAGGTKVIEDLRAGDVVTTIGPDGKAGPGKVVAMFVTKNRLVQVHVDGKTLITTATQPLCAGRRQAPAGRRAKGRRPHPGLGPGRADVSARQVGGGDGPPGPGLQRRARRPGVLRGQRVRGPEQAAGRGRPVRPTLTSNHPWTTSTTATASCTARTSPLAELAETYGTPLYVYSKATLLHHLKQIQTAFAEAEAAHLLQHQDQRQPPHRPADGASTGPASTSPPAASCTGPCKAGGDRRQDRLRRRRQDRRRDALRPGERRLPLQRRERGRNCTPSATSRRRWARSAQVAPAGQPGPAAQDARQDRHQRQGRQVRPRHRDRPRGRPGRGRPPARPGRRPAHAPRLADPVGRAVPAGAPRRGSS